jgi:transcriptional regulator with XRE-family HTH domain
VATKDSYDPAYEAVLEELVSRRKAKGFTQVAVGASMGTDQSQISKFERRERRLDLIDFVRYCLAIDVEPGELLKIVIPLLLLGAKSDQKSD